VQWYRKAAEQGDDDAQFKLGMMYENGWGVVKNNSTGVVWFREAAEEGDTDAKFFFDRLTTSF